MTIPLIQQGGPFQALQQTVAAIQAQRQQRAAQQLQQLLGQAQIGQAQAQTAKATGETNRAQALFERTQQQEQEVQQAVDLVGAQEGGTPAYDQAMASALATIKTPEAMTRFRDALEARNQVSLIANRREIYAKYLQNPTLESLTEAFGVALRRGDEPYARMIATMISSHGYTTPDRGTDPLTAARVDATKALAEQRRQPRATTGGRSGGSAVSPVDRLAAQLRSHYLRLSGRKSRSGAPLYTEDEAMQAAIDLMGVNATPEVIARVRANPTGAPGRRTPTTGGTSNPYR